jgi:prevent-host-death family protein
MSEDERKLDKVGIRELRQNLSVYVRRVREEGRAYEVTERGEPVAQLRPLEGQPTTLVDRMMAAGRIAPATRDMSDVPPPIRSTDEPSLSQILQAVREEESR